MQVLVTNQNHAESVDKKIKLVNEIQNILKRVEALDEAEKTKGSKSLLESANKPLQAHMPFPGISQLTPHLFLCGAGVALPQLLDQLQVNFIINVAPELPDTPLSSHTNPLYLRVDALDRPDVDLSSYFDEVADMIEEVRQHNGKSLVHCVAGVSRSATLCLVYLMKHAGMSLREAYLHVKAIRPQIRPNSGFFQQLRRYEEQLRGSCSVQMVFYESLNKEIPDVYEPEYRAMEEFYQHQRQRSALRSRAVQSELAAV